MDRGIKILVVDDDTDYNLYLTKFLSDEGYQVKALRRRWTLLLRWNGKNFTSLSWD